jgi:zinc protease
VLPLALATALAAPPPADLPTIPFETYQLDNGLTVVLAQDRSTPIVAVNVWYHVGSKDERAGLSGFAHLFEHLMFQGSLSQPGEYFDPLEEVGADINGTTNTERTNYFETLPSQYLPLALFLESDRMGWLLDVFDQKKLDNQREVVRNERRQRYENTPYGSVWVDLAETVWPEGHPYHHTTIGSHEDLQNATVDTVKQFFQTWYSPDNASLVISGDFDPKVAKSLVAKYFADIKSSTQPGTRVHPPVPEHSELAESKEVRQYQAVPQRKVWIAWQSPKLFAPGDAELDLLSSLLTGGKDARMTRRLVKELGIAKDVRASQMSSSLSSTYLIQATASKGHTTDEIVAEIDRMLAEVVADKPPTADELEAARASFEVDFWEAVSDVAGKADRLNNYLSLTGDPGYITKDLLRYREVDAAKVLSTSREVLSKPRVVIHIWPESDRPAPPPPVTPPPATPAPSTVAPAKGAK